MKFIFSLILVVLLLGCSTNPVAPPQSEICWEDVQCKSYVITEQLSYKQNVFLMFKFGIDTVWLTKFYYDPAYPEEITWTRYIKGPVYNKRYFTTDEGTIETSLDFTWKRKEYADEYYRIPVMDNSTMDTWFLLRFNPQGNLLMGTRDEATGDGTYWEFTPFDSLQKNF